MHYWYSTIMRLCLSTWTSSLPGTLATIGPATVQCVDNVLISVVKVSTSPFAFHVPGTLVITVSYLS